MQDTLIPLPEPWTNDDTQAYLNANPLPATFRWKHRDGGDAVVAPKHSTLSGGYGKWLRETPYFQGLFEAIHDIIVEAGDNLPDIETIAKKLNERRAGKNPTPSPF